MSKVENAKQSQKITLFQCPQCNLIPEMIFKFKNGELYVICKCGNNHINSVPLKDFMKPLKDKISIFQSFTNFFSSKIFAEKKKEDNTNKELFIKECSIHKNSFDSYCTRCDKNLCFICNPEHKNHNILSFFEIVPDKNKLEKLEENILKSTEQLEQIRTQMDEIINETKEFLDSLYEKYDEFKQLNLLEMKLVQIMKEQYIKNQKNQLLNYEIIQNINNILSFSITKINYDKLLNPLEKSQILCDFFKGDNYFIKEKIIKSVINRFVIDFKLSKTVREHVNQINQIKIFPNGKIITGSADKSCKIFEPKKFDLLLSMNDIHTQPVTGIAILDNNHFATSSKDKSIKFWYINNNEYNLLETILNAHMETLRSITYSKHGILMSCSNDHNIKLWKEVSKNKHQCITVLSNNSWVEAVIELDNSNLVSGGSGGIKLWKYPTYEILFSINNANVYAWNAIKMLDDDRILCGGSNDGIMKVVSIKKKGIIRTINVLKQVWSILVLNNGIFMSAGVDKNIRIFRSDTYECIRKINNVHTGDIMGFTEVNGNSIMSFACDSTFKIWVF